MGLPSAVINSPGLELDPRPNRIVSMSSLRVSRRSFLQELGVTIGAVQSAVASREQVPTAHDYLQRLAREAPLQLVFRGSSAEECQKWQNEFERVLRSLLGEFRPPDEWRTTRERRVESDDHIRDELILEADGYPPLPIYYLTPPKATDRIPAVLALHGHAGSPIRSRQTTTTTDDNWRGAATLWQPPVSRPSGGVQMRRMLTVEKTFVQ